MKTDKLKMDMILPVTPEIIYIAWLNSKEHSAFTGGNAKIQNKLNSKFSAWDGYITGKIISTEENKKIVQSWRTSEFPDEARDSLLELSLKAVKGGTRLTLIHTDIPKGDKKKYTDGWNEFYFIPMKNYFSAKK